MALLILLSSSCLTPDSPVLDVRAPEECPELALRHTVEIVVRVKACTFGADPFLVELSYEERSNVCGWFPQEDARFTNVYFIAFGRLTDARFAASRATLLIDLWDYDTSTRTKTCSQWRLRDVDMDDRIDAAEFERFVENEWSVVLDYDQTFLPPESLPPFSEIYRYCLAHMLRMLGARSLDSLVAVIGQGRAADGRAARA